MAIPFNMPKLGLTMEEGTITAWLVADGADVAAGAAVLSVETDKVETDVEIPDGGRLHVLGEIGSTYKCGELIGWVLAPGEAAPAGAPSASEAAATPTVAAVSAPTAAAVASPAATRADGRLVASPNAHRRAKELGVDISGVVGSGPGGRIVSEDVEAAAAAPRPQAVASSPAANPAANAVGSATPARRPAVPATFAATELARLLGVDLASTAILPTSPDGRLSRDDVAAHVRTLLGTPRSAEPATPAFAALTQTPDSVVAMKGMRGTIASRMKSSLQDMAQLTLMMDAAMDAVVADREARKQSAQTVPGYTDYVIAAVARALREHPIVNSQVTADGIAVLPQVNVGMAVAIDGGLVVPVVQDTDAMTLADLAVRTTQLADAARSGKLKLTELEGCTFSVTALGSFGVDGFTPVINPPNAAILGVGRLRDDVAWSDDGSIRRVKRLTLSLTWDHRVLDGAPAAEFVRTITRLLDDPTTLG